MSQPKFIFVSGGVLSGLGKGITAASIGAILKARGQRVNIQKLDPYLNVDAGTLNPAEHGECFVTKDGAETDLDLGHYERFLDVELTQHSSQMSGRILRELIEDERAGRYLGKTVQVIPHFTQAIKDRVYAAAKGYDVHIVEIGGTVGDYESPAFFEALRELAEEVGPERSMFVYVVYVPHLSASKEFKTKPAQNAVRELRSLGIQPNVLVARSEHPPESYVRKKLRAFTGVPEEGIVLLPNVDTVYRVPSVLEDEGVGSLIAKRFSIIKKPDMKQWDSLVLSATARHSRQVRVGMVAKYLDNEDTYISVVEALNAAAWRVKVALKIDWIDAEKITTSNAHNMLRDVDGVVVPGGFGERALEGKIAAAQYAARKKVPYLGLCLGMQMATIAIARLAGVHEASSVELAPNTKEPVIHIMEGQHYALGTGGTMRLGNFDCKLQPGSLAHKLYGRKMIKERHRHRYEFNPDYRAVLEKHGVVFSGINPDTGLVEMIELRDHLFFIASQFHPEFTSRPYRSHPLFTGFVEAL